MRPFGDTALVAEVATVDEAHALAEALTDGGTDLAGTSRSAAPTQAGIDDVVIGYRSVTVIADPTLCDLASLAERLATVELPPSRTRPTRAIEVRVLFDGPDLDAVAASIRMPPDEVVRLLVATELRVAFLGFLPGFAYLEGLPTPLSALARRPTPRTAVPAGSFALAGGFAAIYPRRFPGGWHLVGRSNVTLFDPDTPPYATLRPGDVVRIRPVPGPRRAGPVVHEPGVPARRHAASAIPAPSDRSVTVEDPGVLTTVQDLGRIGVAHLGVPRSGAADPYALRAANRLVGNDDDAAGLEATVLGPSLRFDHDGFAAVVGRARTQVDGGRVPCDTVVPVAAGQVLSVGEILDDLRCYIAMAGGIETPRVLGSRAADLAGGVGAGPLAGGDHLPVGPVGRPRGQLVVDRALRPMSPRTLRIVPGPDDAEPDVIAVLTETRWLVSPDSDRVGMRLAGDARLQPRTRDIPSRGTVTGAVQVPTDGHPVVLLSDHATVGGYPVVACVISADLGVLGRCRPGESIRFEAVGLGAARQARASVERSLAHAVRGWYPVESASG